jgi:hypothetical protein
MILERNSIESIALFLFQFPAVVEMGVTLLKPRIEIGIDSCNRRYNKFGAIKKWLM